MGENQQVKREDLEDIGGDPLFLAVEAAVDTLFKNCTAS
jgi:hypothetical protein